MDAALEDTAFLARSPNRVRVLELLARGSWSRNALEEKGPTTRVSVGRILADFEDRRWVMSGGSGYELTSHGRLVYEAFDDLLDRLDRIDDLAPLLPLLPQTLDLDLTMLADTEVVIATPSDPFSIIRRQADRLATADRLRLVTGSLVPELLSGLLETLDGDDPAIDLIAPRSAYESLARNRSTTAELRTLLRADATDCASYPGDITCLTAQIDNRIDIVVSNEYEIPVGVVRSEAPAVLAWFEEWVETHRAAGSRIEPATLGWAEQPE